MKAAEQHAKDQALGQVDLFGVLAKRFGDVKKVFANAHWPIMSGWMVTRDPGALPHRHPINQYSSELGAIRRPPVRSASGPNGTSDHGGGVGDCGPQHGHQAGQQDGDLHPGRSIRSAGCDPVQ